jgi:hypothetical protein
MIAGEPEARQERHRLRHGIPYGTTDLAPLIESGARLGLSPPSVSPSPLS